MGLSKFLPFRLGAGQNVATHASPTASISSFSVTSPADPVQSDVFQLASVLACLCLCICLLILYSFSVCSVVFTFVLPRGFHSAKHANSTHWNLLLAQKRESVIVPDSLQGGLQFLCLRYPIESPCAQRENICEKGLCIPVFRILSKHRIYGINWLVYCIGVINWAGSFGGCRFNNKKKKKYISKALNPSVSNLHEAQSAVHVQLKLSNLKCKSSACFSQFTNICTLVVL